MTSSGISGRRSRAPEGKHTNASPPRPRSIEQVLGSTWQLYKSSFAQMLPLSLIAGVAAVIERVYALIYMAPDQLQTLSPDPEYMAVVFGTLVIDLLAYGALWALADFAARGERMNSLRALGIGWRALPMMTASTVLFIVSMVVGFVLLIVPGAILSVSFFLYGPIIILERRGVSESLLESFRLVQGSWWHTAIIQAVGFGGMLLSAGVFLWLLDLLVAGLGLAGHSLLTIKIAAAAAVAIATTPFSIVLMLEIYRDLKVRRGPVTGPI